MTSQAPERPHPDGSGPQHPIRKYGLAIVAIGGAIANTIQIATTDRPTTQGLFIAGMVLAVSLVPLAYQIGKSRRVNDPAGTKTIEHVMLAEERDMLEDQLERHESELQNIRRALEAAFGTKPPYSDALRIIFDIGSRSSDDHVEESHLTEAHGGHVVHWYDFEAFNRGREQALQWREVLTHLARKGEIGHERVTAVELTGAIAPRALITFAPPHESVQWEVHYRCPGYWDKLRQGGQRFEWLHPPAGPNETNGHRSSVRSVTFIFRIPAKLGTLKALGMPHGVKFGEAVVDMQGSTYRVDIEDVSALLKSPGAAVDPIKWYLELEPKEST